MVGFGNIKSIIVRTSLQWLKDALLSNEAHGIGADEGVMLCEEGGEEKDQNCGPWYSFGSVATDLLVISGFSAQ